MSQQETQLSPEYLISLGQQFGTPLYVYHAEKIKEQYAKLTTAFQGTNTVFFYACKALTNLNILRFVYSIGANVDCSSINEVRLALHAGFPPQRILYTSNGIGFDEIVEAQALGVIINIDSLSNLEKFGQKFGHSYPVGVRLRPNIMAGGNLKISTGHDKSKFGIPVEQIDKVLKLVDQYGLRIADLHIHTGSEIKDVDVFVKGIEILFDLIPKFKELQFIDLGGGFKVPYKEGDGETNIGKLAQKVEAAFANHPNPGGRPLQVWFEPGKFLVSECGYFITRVNVLKETDAATFVSIDSGFNHLIRPMFYDAYHRIENISNPAGTPRRYSVVGNICETDTFAWDRTINEVREGDYLVFYNAGAYGFEMSSNFNSRYKPAEVLVKAGTAHLIRRRDTFEDLLRNQIEL
ncbi:MAG TPA: diaminopimelate decarboxylase [Puia sp.]|jgi:diaminopimelate decarboxylase|nr:diaminopimelate decarboxylase [Puia sp.]